MRSQKLLSPYFWPLFSNIKKWKCIFMKCIMGEAIQTLTSEKYKNEKWKKE